MEHAHSFIDQHKDQPFFLYFASTIPHANSEARGKGEEVPDDAPYSQENWPQQEKNKAAMITRLDKQVGQIVQQLKDFRLDENTVILFSSDNGAHKEGGIDPAFFESSGPLRGIKRDMYEGGIRVPMIVRWPGKVKAGTTNDAVWCHWDFLPTAAELAGARVPDKLDGVSVAPLLQGKAAPAREYLYWEFFERGFDQAVR